MYILRGTYYHVSQSSKLNLKYLSIIRYWFQNLVLTDLNTLKHDLLWNEEIKTDDFTKNKNILKIKTGNKKK